jgi:hypothetical protein
MLVHADGLRTLEGGFSRNFKDLLTTAYTVFMHRLFEDHHYGQYTTYPISNKSRKYDERDQDHAR